MNARQIGWLVALCIVAGTVLVILEHPTEGATLIGLAGGAMVPKFAARKAASDDG